MRSVPPNIDGSGPRNAPRRTLYLAGSFPGFMRVLRCRGRCGPLTNVEESKYSQHRIIWIVVSVSELEIECVLNPFLLSTPHHRPISRLSMTNLDLFQGLASVEAQKLAKPPLVAFARNKTVFL